MAQKFPLRELIEVVTAELRSAAESQAWQANHVMRFVECELEMAIDVEKNASGGISVWVINIGAGGKKTDSNTIRVKFAANPDNILAFPVVESEGAGPALGRETT